jgi:hypothetical protein
MAFSALSAVLQRKVWLRYSGQALYPNLYALLVGPPGTGKTMAIKLVKQVMGKVPGIRHTPQMVSKEKFLQNMVQYGMGTLQLDGDIKSNPAALLDYTCAYPVFLEEFGTFVRRDEQFMRVLTDLYDCHDQWTNETKHSGVDRLKNVYLNLVGGITPASLADDFGDIALNMGFLARFILIYAESRAYVDPFEQLTELDDRELVHDLEQVSRLSGQMQVTDAAKDYVRTWLRNNLAPLPDEPRLVSYCARREMHWIKLAMLISVAESNALILDVRHVEQAKKYLLSLEQDMPKSLTYFGGSNLANTLKSVHRWAQVITDMGRKTLPESALRMQLLRDVPPQYLEQTIDNLLRAGYFSTTGVPPAREFKPLVISH